VSGEPPPDLTGTPDQPPPILGSWRRLYLVLAIELALTVLVLYGLARWAS
jgi:hypothetical protein